MKLIADMHMHTIASGHAYGTIREMAMAASEKNLQMIGITEHAPGIPGTVDPFYYGNLKVVPRNLYGVEILHGCEINVMNDGTLSLEERFIQKLDYAIAGIHGLCYQDAGKEKNTDNLISCIRHEKVKFVSHPEALPFGSAVRFRPKMKCCGIYLILPPEAGKVNASRQKERPLKGHFAERLPPR